MSNKNRTQDKKEKLYVPYRKVFIHELKVEDGQGKPSGSFIALSLEDEQESNIDVRGFIGGEIIKIYPGTALTVCMDDTDHYEITDEIKIVLCNKDLSAYYEVGGEFHVYTYVALTFFNFEKGLKNK